jgi:uncharacterized protein (TIGR00251 family)
MLEISESEGAVLLRVKIVPGASRIKFLGEWQGRARIAVAAPPEKGKANQAVVEFFSGLLDINRRQITVITGHTSPLKTIRIEGVAAAAVQAALQPRRS